MIPDLTVVLASGVGDAGTALRALAAQTGVALECICVGDPASPWPAEPEGLRYRRVLVPRGTSVPVQWSAGAALASAPIVAFTTSDMTVDASWAGTLRDTIRAGAAGAAGEIRLRPDAGPGLRAVYLLRFAAVAPPIVPGPVRDIPADSGAYSRAVLPAPGELAGGFWDAEVHRRLAPDAGPLMLAAGAGATLVAGPSPAAFLGQRFRHGRHFGGFRVGSGRESAVGILLRAPLVPFVLLLRIARRCLARPALRRGLAASLPILAAFSASWALGEAVGALRAFRARGRQA